MHSNTNHSELFLLLQKVIFDYAIPLGEVVEFDKEDEDEFFIATSYASILELSWAILALIDRGLGSHADPQLRLQFETFADLVNQVDDTRYRRRIKLRDLLSFQRTLVFAKSGNPYLREIAVQTNIDDELRRVGRAIAELKKDGVQTLEVEERFKKAGLEDEYQALYPKLSQNSHGSFDSLVLRHVDFDSEEMRILGFREFAPDAFDSRIQSSLDIVLRASEKFHLRFSSNSATIFRELLAKHSYSNG